MNSKLKLIKFDQLERASECLRTMAHPVRLRMIEMLLQDSYTVGELAEACDVQNHVASEHLQTLKACGLLSRQKEGRKVYYEVAEPQLANIISCVKNRFGR